MYIACLDMEGVLIPEMWVEFAKATGIPELMRTTRDEPNYAKLMEGRLKIMDERGLGLFEMQAAVKGIEPFEGARAFLDELRTFLPVIIISDTFDQLLAPIMPKLGYPTLFCNTFEVGEGGRITGYHMRVPNTKYTTVRCLQACGYETLASGDSFNDLSMIQESKAGFFFRTTDQIKAEHPEIPAYERYDELLAAFRDAMQA